MLIIRCHHTEQSIRNIYEAAAEESQLCDQRGNSVNGFIVRPAESWTVRSIYLCPLGVECWRRKTSKLPGWPACVNTNVAIFSTQALPDQPPGIVSGEPGRRRGGSRTCCFLPGYSWLKPCQGRNVQPDAEMAFKKKPGISKLRRTSVEHLPALCLLPPCSSSSHSCTRRKWTGTHRNITGGQKYN